MSNATSSRREYEAPAESAGSESEGSAAAEPSFQMAGSSGAGALSLPITLTAARLSPGLTLDYSSAGTRSDCGLGFAIELPVIGRLTNAGVPTYTPADRFMSSQSGPLTPCHAERTETDAMGTAWVVRGYRPCREGALPLIEHWERPGTPDSYWQVTDAGNVTSVFGRSPGSRVTNPGDQSQVFQWLIEETADAKGNRVVYEYKPEDGQGVPGVVYEQNRAPLARKYPHRIRYGNYYPDGPGGTQEFAFEAVFDYGEYALPEPGSPDSDPYVPVRPWPVRADPFSSYLAGFEIRTYRLCRGVLMFHHFPAELGEQPCLVRAGAFGYQEDASMSLLTSVTETGYQRRADGSYLVAAKPSAELSWSGFSQPAAPRFQRLRVAGEPGGPTAPGYLARGAYQPVDLGGEGLPGFLYSDAAISVFYEPQGHGAYQAAEPLPSFPAAKDLRDPLLSLQDLGGNGEVSLVVSAPASAGSFQRTTDGWSGFRPFRSSPTVLTAGSGERADLDGSGRTDLFFVRPGSLAYYPSRGAAGFGAMRLAPLAPRFPPGTATSGRELVCMAGVFGDGLLHRVRVSDGQVEVWPSLGHGRFGPPVTLADAPRFAANLSTARIMFADVDGSGTADLVFVYSTHVEIYRNQAGNSFAAAWCVPLPVTLGSTDQVTFADLLGSGTAVPVLTRGATAEHWYCDLSRPASPHGNRPYLLERLDNNAGAITEVTYASSTRFFLADKEAGQPWATRLPFSVQVVETITATDQVCRRQDITTFRYRDGYLDPEHREFRGFGFVDISQSSRPLGAGGSGSGMLITAGAVPAAPGRVVKTWYYTGGYTESGEITEQYRAEYFGGDPDAYQMPDSVLDDAVYQAGGETLRQAYAALAGQVRHTEVYALPQDSLPYTVTDANYQVVLVRPASPSGPGSFAVQARESLTYSYERQPADPRISHSFLLADTLLSPQAQDSQMFIRRLAVVRYPRRTARDQVPEQQNVLAELQTGTFSRVTSGFRMIGATIENQALDVGGLTPPASGYFSFAEVAAAIDTALAEQIPYGAQFEPGRLQSRPATWQRWLYWDEAQTAPLPLGQIGPRGLPHHEEQAAFSDTWLAQAYGALVDSAMLTGNGYTADGAGYWWARGLVQSCYAPADPDRFYLLYERASSTPYQRQHTGYDAPYYLMPVTSTQFASDETTLVTAGQADYQAMALWQVTDPNGVVRQTLYDPLGAALATSVFKPASDGQPRVGDGDLREYTVQPDATFDSVLADPSRYLQQAGGYWYHDRTAWARGAGQPASTVCLTRTRFASETPGLVETTVSYTDGWGRGTQDLREAEPASASADSAPRWIVTGDVITTSNGLPVAHYLPRYAGTPYYVPPTDAARSGSVPPPQVTHYDPLGRAVRVDTPKGFLTRTEFGPWQTARYDEDDTLADAPFYIAFMATYPPDPSPQQQAEKAALDQAAQFADSPAVAVLDGAGNAVRTITDSLGSIPPDAFAEIVAGTTVTSAGLWEELHAKGYLITYPAGLAALTVTTITDLVQPYTPGFTLNLDPPYDQFAAATADYLRQACLTSYWQLDQQGRVTAASDPRLYYSNIHNGTGYTSADYSYPMGGAVAALAATADAGARRLFPDPLGNPVSHWDGADTQTATSFDGLGRPLTTTVTAAGAAPRTTGVYTYGEQQPAAADGNLKGRVYQVKDEAGILTVPAYTILGRPVTASRQFTSGYSDEPDWSGEVSLDPEVATTGYTYDALGRTLTQTSPDSTTLSWEYYLSGRPGPLRADLPDGTPAPLVTSADYSAAGQPASRCFGNGSRQEASYEATTGRPLSQNATAPGGAAVQRVGYTYDPAGNLTSVRDETPGLVLGGSPPADQERTYDAAYRLRTATGWQAPGLGADTYATGFKQTVFTPLPPPGSAAALEPYRETYDYDDAGNLVTSGHTAESGTFTRSTPVAADSNRLTGTSYDANGNPMSADFGGPMALAWDSQGNLASATPPAPQDGTWFSYDASGERARKVIESYDATGQVTQRSDDRYTGDYAEQWLTPASGDATRTRTLRASHGGVTVAVLQDTGGSAQVRYQIADEHHSVSLELAQSGTTSSYEMFMPYGGSSLIAGPDEAAVEPKVHRYTGKEADDSTGLYYYGARYQAQWLGRWLSPDPSGTADGLNLYAFTHGNPATYIDSDGRTTQPPDQPADEKQRQRAWYGDAGVIGLRTLFSRPVDTFIRGPIHILQFTYGSHATRRQIFRFTMGRIDEFQARTYAFVFHIGNVDPEKWPLPLRYAITPSRTSRSEARSPEAGKALREVLYDWHWWLEKSRDRTAGQLTSIAPFLAISNPQARLRAIAAEKILEVAAGNATARQDLADASISRKLFPIMGSRRDAGRRDQSWFDRLPDVLTPVSYGLLVYGALRSRAALTNRLLQPRAASTTLLPPIEELPGLRAVPHPPWSRRPLTKLFPPDGELSRLPVISSRRRPSVRVTPPQDS